MKRFSRWSVFAAVPLVLLSLSAGAGSAPAGKAKPLRPVTLVTESAPIRAFAQDEVTIAWINRAYQVRERNLSTRASAVLGSAGPAVSGIKWSPSSGSGRFARALEHLSKRWELGREWTADGGAA